MGEDSRQRLPNERSGERLVSLDLSAAPENRFALKRQSYKLDLLDSGDAVIGLEEVLITC